MKTILVKDDHETGSTTLANPLANPGKQNARVTVKAIHNVPDEFPIARLLQLWNRTCDLTWLQQTGDHLARGRFEFDFTELGEGRILME